MVVEDAQLYNYFKIGINCAMYKLCITKLHRYVCISYMGYIFIMGKTPIKM